LNVAVQVLARKRFAAVVDVGTAEATIVVVLVLAVVVDMGVVEADA
jgi:hypothetical protein